jgi:hypothetical protein
LGIPHADFSRQWRKRNIGNDLDERMHQHLSELVSSPGHHRQCDERSARLAARYDMKCPACPQPDTTHCGT